MEKKHLSLQPTDGNNFIEFEAIINGKTNIPEVAYFHLNKNKSTHSKVYGKKCEIVVDFDKDNNPVGIELLYPSKTKISIIQKLSRQLNFQAPKAMLNMQSAFA